MKKNTISIICLFIGFSMTSSLYSQTLEKYSENFWWGYKDSKTKKIIISPKYGYAEDFKDGLAVISETHATPTQKRKFKAINTKDIFVKDTSFNRIENLGKGLLSVGISDTYGNLLFGIMDKQGNYILPIEYSIINEITNGVIVIKKNDEFGAIDLVGNFIIPMQNEFAFHKFKCNVFQIENMRGRREYGLMSNTGKLLIVPKGSGIVEIGDFNKFCIAQIRTKENTIGLINANGKIIVEPIYDRTSGLTDAGVKLYIGNTKTEFTGLGKKR